MLSPSTVSGSSFERILAWAQTEHIAVSGTVGDPNTALGAIEDVLRRSPADEVIISTLAPGKSNWLETGIVQRLRDETEIPVTHIVGSSGSGGPEHTLEPFTETHARPTAWAAARRGARLRRGG